MFILTKIADLVQIAPEDFYKRSAVAIEDNINAKYSNRVLQKIGLCVCLYDLLWASEGLIGHGTGHVNVNVEFRLIVFRPFKGEILLARVQTSTPDGIHLRNDMFLDFFVPFNELPAGSEYNHSEQIWVWHYEGESLIYEVNEMVRFQVIDEEWHDTTPAGPTSGQTTEDEANRQAPYKIKGSMFNEGLGLCLWWDHSE